jgi:tetratricopeptide (TPR) repeat protein
MKEMRKWLKLASQASSKIKNLGLKAEINYLYGLLTSHDADYSRASKYFSQARKLYEKHLDADGAIRSLVELGKLAVKEDNLEKALDYFELAYQQDAEAGLDQYTGMCYYFIGDVALRSEDYLLAEQWFVKALDLAREKGDETLAAKIYRSLTYVQQELSNS